MERDNDLLMALIDYLKQHGYPPESFVMEWAVGQSYRVDLAVVDPDTNKAIALFELKRRKTEETLKMASRQLESYASAVGGQDIPTYVVFPKEGMPPFEIYYLNKDENISEENLFVVEKIPDQSFLKNSKFRNLLKQVENKQESARDNFQRVCWGMASFLFILLILEIVGKLQISKERLALIGIIIALIIIPSASKLKILGIEYERWKEKSAKK